MIKGAVRVCMGVHVGVHGCEHVCTDVYAHVCMCMHMGVYVHVGVHAREHACKGANLHVCVCTCVIPTSMAALVLGSHFAGRLCQGALR